MDFIHQYIGFKNITYLYFLNNLPKLLCILFLTFFVILTEHLVMKYFYKKESSLQLIVDNFKSSKIDISCFIFFHTGFLVKILSFLTLPGVFILIVLKINSHESFVHSDNLLLIGILYMLILDFAHYIAHILLHKINFLWRYHKWHHEATHFNILVGNRIHLVEYSFNTLVSLILTIFFFGQIKIAIFFPLQLFLNIIDMLQHSNLPANYGKLGYIFASPQFHRFHHSQSKVDHDSNYGNLFSFWDYSFNTTGKRFVLNHNIASKVRLGV